MQDIKSTLVPIFTPLLTLQYNRINRHISVYGEMGTKTLRLEIFKRDWDLSTLLIRLKYLVPLDFLKYIFPKADVPQLRLLREFNEVEDNPWYNVAVIQKIWDSAKCLAKMKRNLLCSTNFCGLSILRACSKVAPPWNMSVGLYLLRWQATLPSKVTHPALSNHHSLRPSKATEGCVGSQVGLANNAHAADIGDVVGVIQM